MGLRINQNIAAMNSYRNLSVNDGAMSKSLEKLSSGFRINRAADDAAGLSISEGLRAQVGGLKVAVRNAQDGVSVAQTAEGALTETHSILQRMRDLAVQSSNGGSQDAAAQAAANKEFGELKTELDRIASTTAFGTQKLLDGSYGSQFQTSASAPASFSGVTVSATTADNQFDLTTKVNGSTQTVTVTLPGGSGASYANPEAYVDAVNAGIKTALQGIGGDGNEVKFTSSVDPNGGGVSFKMTGKDAFQTASVGSALTGVQAANITVATGSGGVFQVGANNNADERINVEIDAMDTGNLGLSGTALTSTTASQDAIDDIDDAIAQVSDQRAKLGAYQNRFEHTINNLNVAIENLSASESRIRDTDMAQEMVNFTRNQILSQAGTSMLAQANQAPQSVLKLLG
ncbi:flagellin N-terminal helical domain-containing protein [Planobispora rosea]|nr:flagellin [Planobispora rosea]